MQIVRRFEQLYMQRVFRVLEESLPVHIVCRRHHSDGRAHQGHAFLETASVAAGAEERRRRYCNQPEGPRRQLCKKKGVLRVNSAIARRAIRVIYPIHRDKG